VSLTNVTVPPLAIVTERGENPLDVKWTVADLGSVLSVPETLEPIPLVVVPVVVLVWVPVPEVVVELFWVPLVCTATGVCARKSHAPPAIIMTAAIKRSSDEVFISSDYITTL